MNIHCLGINHNTAPLALRETLAFTPHQLNASLARLGCGQDANRRLIRECVILSTCNRVEIYAVGDENIFPALENFLAEVRGISPREFSSAAYRLLDSEAVHHLLRVAAGLDSLVLGEPQILGQVADAYAAARQHGVAGKVLSRLFQTAIHAGKRARTETAIGRNPASISSVAVSLIANAVPTLQKAHILVVGAGEMAELAVEALRKRGVSRITVANRTLEKAKNLAGRWNGRAAALESLPELLTQADVVITSTAAPHTIISRQMVEKAMRSRPSRPLVLMDIALPRDVETGVETIPRVERFDIAALSAHLESSLAQRKAEIPAVEAILAEEQAAFLDYLATLELVPIITQIRKQADAIRQTELQKAIRRMPDLSPEARQQLDLLTQSIVKKILHSPTIRLREVAGTPLAADYANLTRGLFGLD